MVPKVLSVDGTPAAERVEAAPRTVTVLGKGRKRRLIPLSAEVTNTVDEYLLTEYPLLDRVPTRSDYLWFPVYHVGDRLIGLKPERASSYRGFYEWWKRVETAAGVQHRKPHAMRHTFATDVLDATEARSLRREGTPRTLVHPRHGGLPPLLADAHGLGYDALAAYRSGNRERD